MGRPRSRPLTPTHRTPGRAGYKRGCGCVDCLEGHSEYQNSYNARRRTAERNERDTDTESAA